jgi:hypothetical protein
MPVRVTIVDLAQVVSGIAAALGLWFAGGAMRQQSRASDAATLRDWFISLARAEADLATAKKDANSLNKELVTYVNLLEIIAVSLNERLLGSATHRLMTDRLLKDLAFLQTLPGAVELMKSSIDSPETFSGITKFIEANRKAFAAAKERQKLSSQTSSSNA